VACRCGPIAFGEEHTKSWLIGEVMKRDRPQLCGEQFDSERDPVDLLAQPADDAERRAKLDVWRREPGSIDEEFNTALVGRERAESEGDLTGNVQRFAARCQHRQRGRRQ
jgi:hypothetical protein